MKMAAKEQEYPLWRFLYPSRPKDEEEAYRQHYQDDDRRQVSTIIFLASVYLMTFTMLDLSALGSNSELLRGVYLRSILTLIGIGLFVYMGVAKHYRAIDFSVLVFSFCVSIGLVLFHLGSEISAIRMGIIIIVYILISYIAFPTYASLISIPALFNLIGERFLVFTPDKEHLLMDQSFMFASIIFCVIFGMVASAYHHRARYHSFRSTRQVKLLSGLLPICANCKKIRDEEGEYQVLEQYITEHSEAFFSHGICPECKVDLYPELGKGG